LLGLFALAVAFCVQIVPNNWSVTVHRRGEFLKTLGPGLHLIVPGLDRVVHRVNIAGQALTMQCDDLRSKDARAVAADGKIYFQVLDVRKAADQTTSVEQTAAELTRSSARDMVEQLTIDSLGQRSSSELNDWLLGLANHSAGQWGVRVTRVDMRFKPLDHRDSEI